MNLAERRDKVFPWDVVVSGFGLVAVMGLGGWWTAMAALAGSTQDVVIRFGVSVATGFYYLVVYRIARYRWHTWEVRRRQARFGMLRR